MSDFLDYAGLGVDVLNMGFKHWQDKRDFDYQKNLQQQIFQREDTSMQRRVADLKAAGLNPALAYGSGADSGAIVGRSNSQDIGASLDTMNALSQIKRQRAETSYLKAEKDKEQAEKTSVDLANEAQKIANLSQKHKLLREMGLASLPYIENGELGLTVVEGTSDGSLVDKKYWSDLLKYEDTYGGITRENAKVLTSQIQTETNQFIAQMNLQNMGFYQALDAIKAKAQINKDTFQMEQQLKQFGLDLAQFEANYNKFSSSEKIKALQGLITLLLIQ